MSTIISICNHKGGVGKTTSVINLAAALGELGKKVLVLDMDPQANSTMILYSDDPFKTSSTTIKLFTDDESSFYTVQQQSKSKNVSIIPTNINMLSVEKEIMGTPKMVAGLGSKLDEETRKEFDYIIIDCPPNLGSFVTNALCISDYYIIPVGAEDNFALKGIENLQSHVNEISKSFNPKLKLLGILITLFDERTTVSKVMKVQIRNFFKNTGVFETIINRNTAMNQAIIKRKTIFQHDRNASGATDYTKLAKEVIKNVEAQARSSGRAESNNEGNLVHS